MWLYYYFFICYFAAVFLSYFQVLAEAEGNLNITLLCYFKITLIVMDYLWITLVYLTIPFFKMKKLQQIKQIKSSPPGHV